MAMQTQQLVSVAESCRPCEYIADVENNIIFVGERLVVNAN